MKELSEAIVQLKNGKAAGIEGIPSEFWKDGGPVSHSKLYELLVCFGSRENFQETSVI